MNYQLQQDLLHRVTKNRQLRVSNAKSYQEWLNIIDVDQDNCDWLKQVVNEMGWPTETAVGKDAVSAARYIAHHSGDNLFMKRCLHMMEPLVESGEVDHKEYAYLMDRYLVSQGKKQRYGTQAHNKNGKIVPCPIENPTEVDERRQAVGLPPMASAFVFG